MTAATSTPPTRTGATAASCPTCHAITEANSAHSATTAATPSRTWWYAVSGGSPSIRRQSRRWRASSGVSCCLLKKPTALVNCKARAGGSKRPNIRKSSLSRTSGPPDPDRWPASGAQKLNTRNRRGRRIPGPGDPLHPRLDVWMSSRDEKIPRASPRANRRPRGPRHNDCDDEPPREDDDDGQENLDTYRWL